MGQESTIAHGSVTVSNASNVQDVATSSEKRNVDDNLGGVDVVDCERERLDAGSERAVPEPGGLRGFFRWAWASAQGVLLDDDRTRGAAILRLSIDEERTPELEAEYVELVVKIKKHYIGEFGSAVLDRMHRGDMSNLADATEAKVYFMSDQEFFWHLRYARERMRLCTGAEPS